MTLVQRGRAFISWLLFEPRFFWLAILVPVVVLAGASWFSPCELGVRGAGFAMTVAGVGLAVFGVLETRALFGQESYRRRLWRWLSSLRPIFGRASVVSMTAHATLPALRASGTLTVQASTKDGSLSARLRAVEENLKRIDDELSEAQKRLGDEVRAVREEFERSKVEHRTGISRVAAKLEEYSTGSLDLQLVGVFWVLAGQAFGSFPAEIARLLHR